MLKRLIAAATLATLAGCAGTPINWDKARTITPGMTQAEVTAVMGSPYLVRSTATGQLWVWSYAGAFNGTKTLSIPFDRSGRVAEAPPIPDSFK